MQIIWIVHLLPVEDGDNLKFFGMSDRLGILLRDMQEYIKKVYPDAAVGISEVYTNMFNVNVRPEPGAEEFDLFEVSLERV